MGSICCSKNNPYEDSKYSKKKRLSQPIQFQSVLLSGSITLTSNDRIDDADEIFKLMHVGKYLPCYKNMKSENIWQNTLFNLENKQPPEEFSKISTYQDDSDLLQKKDHQSSFSEQRSSHLINSEDQNFQFVYSVIDYKILKLYKLKGQYEFRHLVMIGPPQQYRWSCWKTILLFQNREYCQKGQYERMLEHNSLELAAIIKDTDRTLCSHPYFEQAKVDFQFGQNQLQRVLNAVANSLPQLGYCQGMNYLSGLMLIVSSCDESLCYSSFLSLLLSPKHMLYFLYCPDMPLHNFLAFIILKQVKYYFPALYKNVKKEQIPDTFWISKLIISLFLYIMELNNCVRVWDYIISRGSIRALPELMLAVISKLKDRLENADIEQFAAVFQGFVISHEKQQESFDKNFKIGSVILDAASLYLLSKNQVSNYAKKFVKKNLKNSNLKFYKLFTHFSCESSYEKQVKHYIDLHVVKKF